MDAEARTGRSCPLLLRIVKSPCILALMACSFANDWGLYMLLTEGPNFISNVLRKDVATVGFLNLYLNNIINLWEMLCFFRSAF